MLALTSVEREIRLRAEPTQLRKARGDEFELKPRADGTVMRLSKRRSA
jgi:hypothetical protein